MKKIITILIFISILSACSSKQIQEIKLKPQQTDINNLTKFFTTCKTDIQNAVKIISDNKMIGMLTHLKKMDMEGKKYYLLERENLTSMIKSVTEGTYSDLILINSSGVIIYTMVNDEIFGKSIKTHLKDTALNICFYKSSESGFYIEDVSFFPPNSGMPKIFVSFPDERDNFTKGVFIIQIDTEIILSAYKTIHSIVGKDGKYRMDKNTENILKPCDFFAKIYKDNMSNSINPNIEIGNTVYNYYPFNFDNLDWIIISGN